MSSIPTILNILSFCLAIWATTLRWGYRPWVLFGVPILFGFFASMQYANYGSNLVSRALSGSSFESSLDFQQMSDLMSAYMFGYIVVTFVMHLGVIGGLVYMVRNPYGSNAPFSTSARIKTDRTAVAMTEREQRLHKLDELLTSGLITTEEHVRQKQVIEDESADHTAREAAQKIELATAPYVRHLEALRVLADAGVLDEKSYNEERTRTVQHLL